MKAMDQYKRDNRRPFPTWSEVLEVLRALGYRKVAEPTALPGLSPAGAAGRAAQGMETPARHVLRKRPLLIRQIRQRRHPLLGHPDPRYEGRLLAFVDRRLHDRAASEDVVQETFIGFLNSLPNYDETANCKRTCSPSPRTS